MCLYALIAQLVRALVLWAKGRRFEPAWEHFFFSSCSVAAITEDFESSNPSSNLGKSFFYAGMPESGLRGAT